MVDGKKDPEQDPVARFSQFYNHVYAWWGPIYDMLYWIMSYSCLNFIHRASSLILCHDRPRARARQMEKFAEVAQSLRRMNNYSSLRAIITAISDSSFPGDEPMEYFKNSKTEHMYKRFQSFRIVRSSLVHLAVPTCEMRMHWLPTYFGSSSPDNSLTPFT